MKSEKSFSIFNRHVVLALVLLILQQLIVASSTLWITRLIRSIQDGNLSFLWLGIYLISLFLPYFPGAAALIEIAKAKVNAQINFVNRFTKVYLGNVLEWSSSSHHSKKTSTLTGEVPRVIDDYLDYIYHLGSTSLNVSLNLLVLALVINPLFLVSYSIGIGISFIILKIQKNRKQQFSLRSQQSRINWIEMLLKAWDHILVHNKYNLKIWNEKTTKRGNRFEGSIIRLERYSQIVSISMAFSLLIPSFILVFILAYYKRTDPIFLAMLVVVLPRLFQILSYSYEMLFSLADFPMQKSRLETVAKLIDPKLQIKQDEAKQQLTNRIHWGKISAITVNEQHEILKHPAEILQKELPVTGRITLSGENGSGKTSLLLLLKLTCGENAFFLPVKHNLLFSSSFDKLSTGQRTIKILHELLEKIDAPIILLDEWDANLDAENARIVSKKIDELSSKSCVIESRHFRDKNFL